MRTLEAAKLLDEPIPRTQFGVPDIKVFSLLLDWCKLIGWDCGGWSDFRVLLDWLSWALSLGNDMPKLADAVNEKLYRQVNLGPQWPHSMGDITVILRAVNDGDPAAADRLLALIYDELKQLAASKLARESPGQTLSPSDLIHEAYLRLVPEDPRWENRGHFFAAAAEAMRRVLVDRARARNAAKRGGSPQRADIDLEKIPARVNDDEIIEIDSVLDALSAADRQAADIVRLHMFAGLSIGQAATALGVARASAYRDWTFARAWLRDRLKRD